MHIIERRQPHRTMLKRMRYHIRQAELGFKDTSGIEVSCNVNGGLIRLDFYCRDVFRSHLMCFTQRNHGIERGKSMPTTPVILLSDACDVVTFANIPSDR